MNSTYFFLLFFIKINYFLTSMKEVKKSSIKTCFCLIKARFVSKLALYYRLREKKKKKKKKKSIGTYIIGDYRKIINARVL